MFGVKVDANAMRRGYFCLENPDSATDLDRGIVNTLNRVAKGLQDLLDSMYKTRDRVKAWANSWFSKPTSSPSKKSDSRSAFENLPKVQQLAEWRNLSGESRENSSKSTLNRVFSGLEAVFFRDSQDQQKKDENVEEKKSSFPLTSLASRNKVSTQSFPLLNGVEGDKSWLDWAVGYLSLVNTNQERAELEGSYYTDIFSL